jgi:hypothetical protein
MGLVIQVMDRMEMRRIINLKETYITISVEDVVRKIGLRGPEEIVSQEDVARVEELILRMVRIPLYSLLCFSIPFVNLRDFHSRSPYPFSIRLFPHCSVLSGNYSHIRYES